MSITINNNTYTIVYNGQLYNTIELKEELTNEGYEFSTYSDTEVLLKGYICYGEKIFKKLNGVFAFAIWNENENSLFLARDHFGIKPLYYTIFNNNLIFSSEIKSILQYPNIPVEIDNIGISELIGLGPAHTSGITFFKNIYELQPASYMIYNNSGINLNQYWKLQNKIHTDNLQLTCEKIKFLLEDSIKRQLISDVPLCTFLSGGLDSSIITTFASHYLEQEKNIILNTFSVDYIDNDKNFIKNDFQPNSDKYYIDIMTKTLNTNHKTIFIDTPELTNSLKDALIARDLPGMADVDSSLLLFCNKVKKHSTVALSGECADEIFAGYPWFFREDTLNSSTFPWSIAIEERQNLLNKDLQKNINLKKYIDYRYNESINEIEYSKYDSTQTFEKKKISHLTFNWFMQTLLDRSDKMSLYNGLDIRVPFCDYRIMEYVWNIPWEMKTLNGREKGLLRYIAKDFLPDEIVNRKKSPYPKTHNPTYLKTVKNTLLEILNNSNSPVNNIIDKNYVLEIINTDGKSFTRPWFGQLMTGPQLMAYLIQINMWFEIYNVKISI